MARPSNGYVNAAGQPVPGTTDIIGRFKDYSRLMFWAFSRGKQGAPKLYDNSALDIGTAVHTMAELDLKGDPAESIEFYLTATLRDLEEQEKARNAFAAFKTWRAEFAVEPYVQEISLVSEKLQYGGTLDNVSHIRRGRGMLDFKSSTKGEVYEDHVLQLAGYDILWEETHPDEPIDEGYHLIVLPKDGSKPIHREWTKEQLHPFRQKFWLLRKAYDYDAICNDPATLQGTAIKPSKPRAPRREKAIEPAPASMGEMLRRYGLIREEARA
jgi:hypothetical protein